MSNPENLRSVISQEIPQPKLREIFSKNIPKIEKVIEELNKNKLKVFLDYRKLNGKIVEAEIRLINTDTGEEKGHYNFEATSSEGIQGSPVRNTINIDDELQGKGFAWLMVGSLIGMLKNDIHLFTKQGIGLNTDTIVGIFADAGQGYWDHIGLTPGRYTWDLDVQRRSGTGESMFEKTTTLGKLSMVVLGQSFGGGGGKKKNKKFNKTKKIYKKLNKKNNKKTNKKTTKKSSKKYYY